MQGGMVMVSTPVELPDNLPACHAIILRQAEAIEQLEARIERLNRDLASLKRQLFGSRRERFEAGSGEDPADQGAAAEASARDRGLAPGLALEGELTASEWLAATAAGPTRRT